LQREVYVSQDKKTVIKILRDKMFLDFDDNHNALEAQCYDEAPEWCKRNIAVSELKPEGYIIQEYFDNIQEFRYPLRELAIRADGTLVIFDCDILLNTDFSKPKIGFKYQEVFGNFKLFGDAHHAAIKAKKELEAEQRNITEQHFGQDYNIRLLLANGTCTCYVNGQQISEELAKKCGFHIDTE
jgi:hypothetical protein